ncbi:MAG: MerR family transcriptional regulator [Defluviitaleaceae bacterium]|nr:MerR family transcriptional regulator [Defluviitaleaceae bacterium]
MNELTKIKDVSARYAITARTLRYYEDIGLLVSVRTPDYAHRMYDGAAIMRLKQILILRKLNISVKDIKRIFAAANTEVVLEVLDKKADDIDEEVALLHELKAIVLEFIAQVKKSDFHNENEVKLLYDKAKEIETQLAAGSVDAPADEQYAAARLAEVAEKLDSKRFVPPIAVNTYKQRMNGAWRFIGKRYASADEAWGNWSEIWGLSENNYYENYLFKQLMIDPAIIYCDGNPQDGSALIGLMYHNSNVRKDCEPYHFEYWLGCFTPANTLVPEGYDYADFPEADVITCWLYGKNEDVYAHEPVAFDRMFDEGFKPHDDWWFERYVPHREIADKHGYKIADICFFQPINE